MSKSKLLIYDSKVTGHHIEYIKHLLKYIVKHKLNEFTFLLNPAAKEYIKPYKSNICIDYIKTSEIEEINQLEKQGKYIKRTTLERNYILDYAQKNNIIEIILLQIDSFEITLGSRKMLNSNILVSGILFTSHTRTPYHFSRIKTKLWQFLQVCWMLRNKNLKNVFVLNDQNATNNLNKIHCSNTFKYLPDPIVIKQHNDNLIDIREMLCIPKPRKIALILGSIYKTKNLENIIEAIIMLPVKHKQSITLLIQAGRCYPESYEKDIRKFIIKKLKEDKDLSVIFRFKYIDEKEMNCIFKQVDYVFVAYKDFYTSSGVLNHAIKHQKPVLASRYGVIGDICKAYNLGELVEPYDIQSISKGIERLILRNTDFSIEKKLKNYIKWHHPSRFSSILLGRLKREEGKG